MDLVLAYDVGTSGTKAVLINTDGQVQAKAFEPYPTTYPRPLWAEQDPEDWWRAIAATTRRVLQAAGVGPDQVAGIAFTTQMVNLIPLDAAGAPLRPCISWLDGRAGIEARGIMRRLGGERIFAAILGAGITGKDVLPKMLWLKKHEPEVYRRAATLVDVGGYLLLRTTGRRVVEWSVASVTGLFHLKHKTWDEGMMRLFGLERAKFPDLVQSIDRVGGLTPSAAADLGLRAGTPVFGGAGDGMSAPVGAGAVGDGDGHLMLGTSGFIGAITRRKVTGKGGIVTLQSADPQHYLLIAEMETAAGCLRWAVETLYGMQPGSEGYQTMDREVAASPPGAGNLLFTPWMYGERAPVADERLRASFINLGTNHTRGDMARAIYEGVAFNYRWLLESLERGFGFRPDPLRVIGGGARSAPWVQILADITGRTMEVMPWPQEAAAVGGALLAAVGLGVHPSITSLGNLLKPERVVTPAPSAFDSFQPAYATFQSLYAALRPIHHRMNAQHDD
jgi:xylulokinase